MSGDRAYWLEAFGVPSRYSEQIASGNFDRTKAIAAIDELELEENEDLRMAVFGGAFGVGKSFAAGVLLNRFTSTLTWRKAEEDCSPSIHSPIFITAEALSRMSRYDDEQRERLELAEVLVVDDLGQEFDDEKGNFRSLFDSVINARYASDEGFTVLTTNLSVAKFRARYGERIADRIRQVGIYYEFGGKSLRKRKNSPVRLVPGGDDSKKGAA